MATNHSSLDIREEPSFITETSFNDIPLKQFNGSWPALWTPPPSTRIIEGDSRPATLPPKDTRDPDNISNNHLDRGLSKRKTVTAIVVGSIGAIFCMIGHHLFLSWLDGRHANAQFWTKNASNAFSQLCVVFIGLVAGSVLSQLVWRTVSQRYTRISAIDDLFSLPSPLSIISLIGFAGEYRAGWLLLPIVMALFIQALVVVSILAPNSLGIQPDGWMAINTTIPKLDFGSITNYGNLYLNQGPSLGLMIATSGNTWDIWDAPSDCQSECLMVVEYQAPAVQCRDLQPEEITVGPYNGSNATWIFYNTEFTPPKAEYDPLDFEWAQPYIGFQFEYLPSVSKVLDRIHLQVNQTGVAAGSSCEFLDGKFQADFSITSGVKHVEVTTLSYTNGSIDGCTWDSNWNSTTRCANYGVVARSLVRDFVHIFSGNVGWEWSEDIGYSAPSVSHGEFLRTSAALVQQVVNLTFVDDPDNPTIDDRDPNYITTIKAGSANLSKTFEDLFTTTMLAAMVRDNRTEFGLAQTSDGASIWAYSRLTLWVTYGPTVAILLALTMYGLWHAKMNKRPLGTEFSTLFITSRNRALNGLFLQHQDVVNEGHMKLDHVQRHFVPQEAPDGLAEHLIDRDHPLPNDGISQPSLPPFRIAPTIMVGAFLIAIVLAVLHHVFLTMIREKPVTSQFWMRNISNGLSQAFTFCLTVTLAHALTQVVWRAVRLGTIPIAGIDYLFSLPSPSSILTIYLGHWSITFLLAISITWTTYGLFFIGVLAPNVLTIGKSAEIPADFVLPYLNYSHILSALYQDTLPLEGPATYTPPEQMWITPDVCTNDCAFDFDYEAPALLCFDVSPDEALFNGPFNMVGGITTFPGQSILRANVTSSTWLDWGPSYYRQLEVTYIPADASISRTSQPTIQRNGNPVAAVCNYTDGAYQARFQRKEGVKTVTTTLVHYNNSFTERCSDQYGAYPELRPCDNYPLIANHLADRFGGFLESVVGFWQNGTQWSFKELPGYDTSYYNISQVSLGLLRLFDYHTNVTANGAEVSLDLKVPSLSQGLVDLFSNYTLNMMRAGQSVLPVTGSVWGETVWKVDLFTLWCIYGTALGWSFILGLYGIWAMYDNGGPLDNSVSTIMLATRTEELDDVYESMPNHAALSRLRLRHQKKGCFVVDGMQPKVEGKGGSSALLIGSH